MEIKIGDKFIARPSGIIFTVVGLSGLGGAFLRSGIYETFFNVKQSANEKIIIYGLGESYVEKCIESEIPLDIELGYNKIIKAQQQEIKKLKKNNEALMELNSALAKTIFDN